MNPTNESDNSTLLYRVFIKKATEEYKNTSPLNRIPEQYIVFIKPKLE